MNNSKVCFGRYEDGNNSWHCRGCILSNECKERKELRKEKKIMVRPSKDNYYLDIAIAVSKRSTCLHRHYGCVIVKDDIIIATGYNGSPRGCFNCCDMGECKRAEYAAEKNHQGYEKCDAVHAEQNAMLAAKKSDLVGAILYLACEECADGENFEEDEYPTPCNICRNMIINAGIETVINRGGVLCL